MKITQIILLLLLSGVSTAWLMLYATVPFTIGYTAVDAIVPPGLLAKSTPGETSEMAANINKLVSRPRDGWVAPSITLTLSLASLALALLRPGKTRKA